MAARVVDKLPEGDEWIYEVKFDGYRALVLKNGERVQIRSRNGKDLTSTYPSDVAAGRPSQVDKWCSMARSLLSICGEQTVM